MLEELHIQDFAIIDDLKVCFGPGLNVLTGETGAGKSILIGAIQLLLGVRGRVDQIREGAAEAVVEGLFDLTEQSSSKEVPGLSTFKDAEEIILRRVISRGGKSRAYINGQLCTLQLLAECGRLWVNIYGQHEHQILLQQDRHVDLLDEYGGLSQIRANWDALWHQLGAVKKEIEGAQARKEEVERRRELWEFQCEEIERAQLKPDEEGDLERELQRLLNAHRIQEGLLRAEETLYGERGSALERIQSALREVAMLAEVEPELEGIVGALNECALHLEEGVQMVRAKGKLADPDPQRLQVIEERLSEIRRLRRKHNGTVEEIIALGEELETRLGYLKRDIEGLEELRQRQTAIEEDLLRVGGELRRARETTGERLAQLVENELKDLGIDHPVFAVEVAPLSEGESVGGERVLAGPRGMDQVALLLSTNVGEPPRPLSRIASGGELSRIMLALKRVLAEAERVPTLIFDEIDAGIGGAVAEALGEKLAHVTRTHQVLCITHLPQIARYASTHFRVGKRVESGRTVTRVEQLDIEERVEEISRMLGGRVITDRTRAHAREMLKGVF